MFCSKTNYKKIEQIQKRDSRIVYNEPHMSLEELLIRDQGISVHRKQINTYFMKSIFTKKDVIYNLRTSNLLTLPKINTKRFGLYFFSFRASHLWSQLPDHIK